jgi:hypothetical protein
VIAQHSTNSHAPPQHPGGIGGDQSQQATQGTQLEPTVLERFSSIRRQAKPRLKKDHREKVISFSASDVIKLVMES